MGTKRRIHSDIVIVVFIALYFFISSGNYSCHRDGIVKDATLLPLPCDSAVRMLTHDWLEANLSASQKDSLKLPANKTAIQDANDFGALETIFANIGVPNLQQRLVDKKIKSDPVCRVEGSIEKPSFPDSMILKPVKGAIQQFLQ